MTDQTLLGVVGSVSADSRTRTAVEVALDAAVERHDIETDVLHLADYDLATADGRGIDNYEGDTAEALELIVEADAYVVGTPVYPRLGRARTRRAGAVARASSTCGGRGARRAGRPTTTSSRRTPGVRFFTAWVVRRRDRREDGDHVDEAIRELAVDQATVARRSRSSGRRSPVARTGATSRRCDRGGCLTDRDGPVVDGGRIRASVLASPPQSGHAESP